MNWFTSEPTTDFHLFVDNESAIKVADQPLPTKKTKHYNLRWHLVKEDRVKNIAFCPTDFNRADALTKPIPKPLMVYHVRHRSHFKFTEDSEGVYYLPV